MKATGRPRERRCVGVGATRTVPGGPQRATGVAVHPRTWTVAGGCHYDLPLADEPSGVHLRPPAKEGRHYLDLKFSFIEKDGPLPPGLSYPQSQMVDRVPTTLVRSGPVTLEGPSAGRRKFPPF